MGVRAQIFLGVAHFRTRRRCRATMRQGAPHQQRQRSAGRLISPKQALRASQACARSIIGSPARRSQAATEHGAGFDVARVPPPIAHVLTASMTRLLQLFRAWDVDGDGSLSVSASTALYALPLKYL